MGQAARKLFEFERFIAKKNVFPGQNVILLYDTITITRLLENHMQKPTGFWHIPCLHMRADFHRRGWSFKSVSGINSLGNVGKVVFVTCNTESNF